MSSAKAERQRRIRHKQATERVVQCRVTVACGKCGRIGWLIIMYKCFYCGIWFCGKCAQRHFQ